MPVCGLGAAVRSKKIFTPRIHDFVFFGVTFLWAVQQYTYIYRCLILFTSYLSARRRCSCRSWLLVFQVKKKRITIGLEYLFTTRCIFEVHSFILSLSPCVTLSSNVNSAHTPIASLVLHPRVIRQSVSESIPVTYKITHGCNRLVLVLNNIRPTAYEVICS